MGIENEPRAFSYEVPRTNNDPVHTKPEEFKNSTVTGHFGFVVQRKTREGKSNDYRDAIVLEKLLFSKCLHENEKPAFSNSSGLRKAPLSLRISVNGRPNRRNKAFFHNSPYVVPQSVYFLF